MAVADDFINYLKLYESEINAKYNNINNDILKNYITLFIRKNTCNKNDADYLWYSFNNDQYFLDECKNALSDKHDFMIFNKITGKNYTIDSLHRQISKLICGYLYIELPKYIQKVKDNITKYPQSIVRILNYGIYDIINNFKISDQFCQEHFNMSLKQFNKYAFNISEFTPRELLLQTDYDELYNDYVTMIQNIDDKVSVDRKSYLLNLNNDDKIGQYYGNINYNPHDVDKRDAPILVYKDLNNIDHVLIGTYGQNHIDIYPEEYNKQYISECYYYAPCAFIDKLTIRGYNIEEITNILINDSRIKKVYLTPEYHNDKLKRLANK